MSAPIELVVITPAEVSAFVDSELDAAERRDVVACARDDERVACLLAAWRWQLGLLHAAFGRIVEEPVPERLRLTVGGAAPGRSRRSGATPPAATPGAASGAPASAAHGAGSRGREKPVISRSRPRH